VDGKLDETAWSRAIKSPRFIDVIGGTPGVYDTRSALLWDDACLYIAFWCEEPYPEATITQRDGLLWFEICIARLFSNRSAILHFQSRSRSRSKTIPENSLIDFQIEIDQRFTFKIVQRLKNSFRTKSTDGTQNCILIFVRKSFSDFWIKIDPRFTF
jgi:hypothetical protein